ncbi:hypothetical protein M1446_02910 [Candidatus Dependentiae bacterium]|nr:hypothetical protein [Candidatus Dependentiae bacterium]
MNLNSKFFSIILFSFYCLAMENNTTNTLALEPASHDYQVLSTEAQLALGLPVESHFPIKKFNQPCPQKIIMPCFISINDIFINEKFLKNSPYALKRCFVFLAAVKAKYKDAEPHEILQKKYSDIVNYIVSKGKIDTSSFEEILKTSQDLVSKYGETKVKQFGEELKNLLKIQQHRTDTEGLYATQCYHCVRCYSKFVFWNSSAIPFELRAVYNHGNLSSYEIDEIAEQLEQQNKICAEHKNTEKTKEMLKQNEFLADHKNREKLDQVLEELHLHKNREKFAEVLKELGSVKKIII